ncbi:MAG: hypothetical protein ACKPKO_09210, partial [Candidatus Fonsibacter sp.]
PRERMPLEQSITWFFNIWTGNKTMLDMYMDIDCHNVVMLFPDRSEYHLSYVALLLRNLAQLYIAHQNNILQVEWCLGILSDVHRFPMDREGNEQIQLGSNLADGTGIPNQSTWGVH